MSLRAVDAEGMPVSGAAVELDSTKVRQHDPRRGSLGGHVSEWMEAGWLAPQTLVTDRLGGLVLDGMPEGDYRVRVTAGGASANGMARIGGGVLESVFVVAL